MPSWWHKYPSGLGEVVRWGLTSLSPVLLVVINNDGGNSHVCSFVVSGSFRLSRSPYLLCCISPLHSVPYLWWPPLELEVWQGQKRPNNSWVCIKQEAQTKMATEYRHVQEQRRKEEWRVTGNGGVCGKPEHMLHWEVGQLCLACTCQLPPLWKHKPNAATSPNIKRN